MYEGKKSKKGFTLIEVLLTLIIISIVVIMAIPRMDSTGARVRTISRQIIDDMRYARTKAITDARNVAVDFSSATQYTVDGVAGKGSEQLSKYNISCSPVPITFTFNKLGSVTSTNGEVLSVSKDGYSITINVIPSTGMVYKSDD